MGPKLKKGVLNERMHPRNIFRDRPPDFARLADKYPDFAACVHKHPTTGKVWVNFKDPATVRLLTQVTLLDTFGIRMELPPDCLVPRIPSRLNYILWIQDLLSALSTKPKTPIRGLDIGTGASVVYPLLGTAVCGWEFVGTEKCPEAAEFARQNVIRNKLQDSIRIVEVSEGQALSGLEGSFHFCMCNPPFFRESEAEAGPSLVRLHQRPNRPPPHSVTVARHNEVHAEGGEVGFVRRIIRDSAELTTRVTVYSSLVGRKSSVRVLLADIREAGALAWTHTMFCQGKTPRWGLAWTFTPGVALTVASAVGKKKPIAPITFSIPEPSTRDQALSAVTSILKNLRIEEREVSPGRVECTARTDTWSHSRRKRRADKRPSCVLEEVDETSETGETTPMLVFSVTVDSAGAGRWQATLSTDLRGSDQLNQIRQHLSNRLCSPPSSQSPPDPVPSKKPLLQTAL